MITGVIIVASVLAQFATVFMALRLIPVTRSRLSWILISSSIFFMALRRSVSLFQYLAGDPLSRPDLSSEIVGLITSLLMLAGVVWISPLFKSMAHEINGRRLTEETLRKSEKSLNNITSNLAEGIYAMNKQGQVIFMNPEAERLLGWTIDELNEKCPHDLIHYQRPDGSPLPLEKCHMHGVIKTGKPYTSTDEVFVRKDGTVFPVSVITSPIMEDGNNIASVTAFRDITEHKQMEKIIRHQASHDSLTDLPNRNLFNDHLSLEIAKARRRRKKLAVLLLDLDRFKNINDTLGHDAGDNLLKQVSRRIKSCIRESDVVGRMGGDEFNILQTDISHAKDAAVVAGKILTVFRDPYVFNGHELYILASIGISIYPDDGNTIADLMKNADIAMYDAKLSGRNRFRFFNSVMNSRTQQRMLLENSMRQSIRRNELRIYYQAQADISTGWINSAEALVRWQHSQSGLIGPEQFLPLAEETGFITAIDEWVLRTACLQMKAWQDAGLPPVYITVNLSARQLRHPDLARVVELILNETKLAPGCLGIDIPEKAALQDAEQDIAVITRIAKLGVRFSIDDFGAGFSSLRQLTELPVDKIKIDKSLISDITMSSDSRAVISGIISLTHNLDLKAIAEGVENREQIAFLRSAGCDEIQGHIINKPLPAEEFRELLLSERR